MLRCSDTGVVITPRCVDVHGTVMGDAVSVLVEQCFVHARPGALKLVYSIPVPADGVVVSMMVEMRGRVTVAVVKEREEARETYERAIATGQSSQLLEQTRGDVFTLLVGAVPENVRCTVRIGFLCALKEPGRFVLPTFVAPRYHPTSERTPVLAVGPVDTDDGGVAIRFTVLPSDRSFDLRSTTHVLLSDERNTVRTPRMSRLDSDFELLFAPREASDEPVVLVEQHEGSCAVMCTVMPCVALVPPPTELLFVVDQSGSMREHNRLEQVKEALHAVVSALEPDVTFNVVRFGTLHVWLWPESRAASPENRACALAYIAELRADMGGTVLAPVLHDVFVRPVARPVARPIACPAADGTLHQTRQVLVFTDGEVSNVQEVVNMTIAAHRDSGGRTRVFAMGIGHGASSALVEGLARAGGGTSVMVLSSENLKQHALTLVQRARQPSIRLECRWNLTTDTTPQTPQTPPGPAATVVGSLLNYCQPAAPPPMVQAPRGPVMVHSGQNLTVFAIVPAGSPMPRSVTLCATTPAGILETTVPLAAEAAENLTTGRVLHQMAANAAVREMLDGKTGAEQDLVRREVVHLGTQYTLGTPFTSFVAVQGDLQTTAIIGRAAQGSAQGSNGRAVAPSAATSFSAAMFGQTRGGGGGGNGAPTKSACSGMFAPAPKKVCVASPNTTITTTTTTSTSTTVWTARRLQDILCRKTLYGYFLESHELASLLCIDFCTLTNNVRVGSVDAVWVTAVVVVILRQQYLEDDTAMEVDLATAVQELETAKCAQEAIDTATRWLTKTLQICPRDGLTVEKLLEQAKDAVNKT